MTHFGIFCPGATGHLNPMCVLGRELLRRGHKVTLFGVPDVQAKVAQSGLAFWAIGSAEFPLGSLDALFAQLGKMSGIAGTKFSVEFFKKEAEMLLQSAPLAIQQAGVEALIVDQVTSAAGTVADWLKLPFVTVCNALLTNQEPGVPPYFTPWQYHNAGWAKLRNRVGNALGRRLTQPVWQVIVQQRQQWQLPPHQSRGQAQSRLAQICQLPAIFDFPRERLPDWFHYTGPLQDPSGLEPVRFKQPAFPFEQLTEQPLIYASLGTLQNRKDKIFHCIAEACRDLEAQLVISLGNSSRDASEISLPGSPLVVSYAPQQQLIQRSHLVITHAGLNTVLETLSAGVPLVAIPITNEQPGVAARLDRTGAGTVVKLSQISVAKLRATILQTLTEPTYRQNAAKVQAAIQASGGVQRAANIVEESIASALSC
ncbi:MAG: glycosyltransferase [Oscillatoriophycideae cyanobacterium NC_groundwater_1537_Pr4_S-0.65um_50_18]|nr:glycosyltransferase [Oscillatoriophycideae cyanobacterium NC_groundwater_1537_Pr4_S-0.65um_50_18]